jgi:YVTN family beta-propeller protein
LAVSTVGSTIFGVLLDKRIVIANTSNTSLQFAATGINTPTSAKLTIGPGDKLYVVDPTNDYVAVFKYNGVNYTPTDIVSPGGPSDIAVNSDGSRFYVVNKLAGAVSVYNGSTNALVTTIPIGGSPNEVEIDSTGTFLYVSDSTTKKVSIVRLA